MINYYNLLTEVKLLSIIFSLANKLTFCRRVFKCGIYHKNVEFTFYKKYEI